jgi:hypothetical protein
MAVPVVLALCSTRCGAFASWWCCSAWQLRFDVSCVMVVVVVVSFRVVVVSFRVAVVF